MINREEISVDEMECDCAKLLAEIHKQSFVKTDEQIWSESDFEELLKVPGTKAIIMSRNDVPVGFSLVRGMHDEAEIITFCILPKWCDNGYATLLLEWIIKGLQRQSIKRLFLEVRENNEAAIRLYKKCSFKTIGRRKGYYNSSQSENADALVMQCELDV